MEYTYKTRGTCSRQIKFDLVDGKVSNVSFVGGCNGNLQGISLLVEGMEASKVIEGYRLQWQRYIMSCSVSKSFKRSC